MSQKNNLKWYTGVMIYSLVLFVHKIRKPIQLRCVRLVDYFYNKSNGRTNIYYRMYTVLHWVLLYYGCWKIFDLQMKVIKFSDKLRGWEYGVGYKNDPKFTLSN